MRATGGRRMTLSACVVVLAVLAAGCSGGSDSDEADDVPTDIDAEVTVGGGSSGSVYSIDSGVVASGGRAAPGLSVRGVAGGTVPADIAFVVVVPPGGGIELLGESSVTPEDRKGVVDGVAAMGGPRGDIPSRPTPASGGRGSRSRCRAFPLHPFYAEPEFELILAAHLRFLIG